jgi:hypothetical protein
MKHTVNLYNDNDFPANLMVLLDMYCDHVFLNGSANLAAAHEWEDQKNILVELEAAAKLHIQVKEFFKGETKEVQLPVSLICPIISFMGWAKMYNPEIVIFLIGLLHG